MNNNASANAFTQNAAASRALRMTSPRYRKPVGTFTGAVGQTTRVKLDNVGVLTGVLLRVYGTFTSGTAAGTPSDAAPFNVIRRVKFSEYDGTDRVDVSGHHLWLINSQRERQPYGYHNDARTAALTLPKIDTSATGSGKAYEFFLYVPLAYNPETDLRGAILAQTGVGELYLSVDWASAAQWIANGNEDAVLTSATGTVSAQTCYVDVWQDYLVARDMGNGQVPLPLLDLMTVYELKGSLRSTDNLGANLAKQIDIPNVRSVVGATFTYLNNGAYTQTDLSRIQVVVNSTNVIHDNTVDAQFNEQRRWARSDLGKAAWFLPTLRAVPIQTAQIGNTQVWITPSAYTSSANTWIERTFESFYSKGSTLPGVNQ